MDKHAILAVKKKKANLVFFCEKYIKETLSGQFVCKTTSFRLFFDYNYAMQMRHAAFSILPPKTYHFLIIIIFDKALIFVINFKKLTRP